MSDSKYSKTRDKDAVQNRITPEETERLRAILQRAEGGPRADEELPEIWAIAEIARYSKVSRQTAHNWVRAETFPEPQAELSVGRVWAAEEVREWLKDRDAIKGIGEKFRGSEN